VEAEEVVFDRLLLAAGKAGVARAALDDLGADGGAAGGDLRAWRRVSQRETFIRVRFSAALDLKVNDLDHLAPRHAEKMKRATASDPLWVLYVHGGKQWLDMKLATLATL
jgi:hypothetical protein